jgi:protein mago nashi
MHGHEYLEFEVRPNGQLRYANHSNYKKDTVIRKEVIISEKALEVLRGIIVDSQALSLLDDRGWPVPDRNGAQELEIVMNSVHLNVSTAKINSLVDIQRVNKQGMYSKDVLRRNVISSLGLLEFYYLVQDIKSLVFALMALHFKIKPI